MSKKMRVLMLVLAALMIVPSTLAGCGGSEDPAATTEATTAATTTAVTTTEATTEATTAATTTEATTTETTTTAATAPAKIDLGGYEFLLHGDKTLKSELGDGEEETAEYLELIDLYESIEKELNCTITVARLDVDIESMTAATVGGVKFADFINCRQNIWIPLIMMGGLRPLDEMVEGGLDLYNDDVFNQTYTLMTNLRGPDGVEHIWGLDITGKYASLSFGHYFAFNKELCEAVGYPADTLYQIVRDGDWNYELMLEIGRKITKDTDGDGVYDVHGLALDCDGNEIWTNGVDFITFDEASGKWIADCMNPQLMPALQFMADISAEDMQIPVFGNIAGRGDRRTNFYQGKAGFAGLYGGNIDNEQFREMAGNGLAGALPLPKGPNAEDYVMCFVDFGVYVCLTSNQDWEKSVQIMNALGAGLTDWDAYREQCLDYYGGDEQAIEMIFDIAMPNGFLNIAKASDDLYQITRQDGFFSNIYELVETPASAAEKWQDVIQAELDNIFRQ